MMNKFIKDDTPELEFDLILTDDEEEMEDDLILTDDEEEMEDDLISTEAEDEFEMEDMELTPTPRDIGLGPIAKMNVVVSKESHPKIWHCGHGSKWGRPDEKEEKKKLEKFYEDGLKNNSCFIHHELDEHYPSRGYNTTKQMKKFKGNAKEGDIVFTHCVLRGGLTHYGVFTGEIIPKTIQGQRGDRNSIHSHICVYEWIPLPEKGMKGVGRNCTLYEVTKESNNYQNYTRYLPSS